MIETRAVHYNRAWLIVIGFFYAVVWIGFNVSPLAGIGIELPFRKLSVPIVGWCLLFLYGLAYNSYFKADLKNTVRKMVIMGIILHLTFLIFKLNVQLIGDGRVSTIYILYIKTVAALSLFATSVSWYVLRRDLFFAPLAIASGHMALAYLHGGFIAVVLAAALACIAVIISVNKKNILVSYFSWIVSTISRERNYITALFLFGFITRFIFALQMLSQTGAGQNFVLGSDDGLSYDGDAWAIVKDPSKIISGGTIFPGTWDPGYIYFVAIIYKMFGHNFYALTFFQSVLGGALSILGYYIALEIFNNKKIGILTSVLLSLSQLLIMYYVVIGAEVLISTLLAVYVYLYLRYLNDPDNALVRLSTGVTVGLLCITRSLFLLLPIFIFVFEVFISKRNAFRRKIKNFSTVVLIASCLISVITFINFLNSHQFHLVVKSGHRLSSSWNATSAWRDLAVDNRELSGLGIVPFDDLKGTVVAITRNPVPVAITAARTFCNRVRNYMIWPSFGFFDPMLLINSSRIPNEFASSMEFYIYLVFLIGLYSVLKEFPKRRGLFIVFAVIIYSIFAHCSIIVIQSVRYRIPAAPYFVMIGAVGLYHLMAFVKRGLPRQRGNQ